jgi:hypothetical protein
MLAATVASGSSSLPVRIRNLSVTGALLEGDRLPRQGDILILKRGDLEIEAVVAWSGGNKCGVKFDRPTPVNDWTGGKPRPLECTGGRDQRRVDAIQAEARGGHTPPIVQQAPAVHGEKVAADLDGRLADELAYVQRLLESLGDELIGEPAVVLRHSRALQGLDIASQILSHVASVIVAGDREGAVEQIGMQDLRARLKRKPLVSA